MSDAYAFLAAVLILGAAVVLVAELISRSSRPNVPPTREAIGDRPEPKP